MHRPHICSLAIAVALAATATLTAGTALAAPYDHRASAPSPTTSPALPVASVVDAARTAAFAHASATGVGERDGLKAKETLVDPEGKRHVRFVRTHRGLPVLGGDLIVHLDAKSAYLGATRATDHRLAVPTVTPKVTATQAKAKAAAVAKGDAEKAELVVDARDGKTVLAYRVEVTRSRTTEVGGARTVVVDAITGAVRSDTPVADPFVSPQLKEKLRESGGKLTPKTGPSHAPARTVGPAKSASAFPAPATGTGASLFSGSVRLGTTQTGKNSFLLKDPAHGNTQVRDAGNKTPSFSGGKAFTNTTNRWGDGTNGDRATAAVDAQYGITSTLDYYKNAFGRNGIKGDGTGAKALVHYGEKVDNAYWSPSAQTMLYGDGGQLFKNPLVVLDVTAHELTHGVVNATADLQPTRAQGGTSYGEPAALNESLSDIFATSVEFAAGNAGNPPNYLLGEKLGLKTGFLRRLDKPSLGFEGDVLDYWKKEAYDTESHRGSGISSHAYYLLAEGSGKKKIGDVTYDSPTFDGSAVSGIGRDKASAIFYRALTRYMVSTTDFHDARTATLKAADDIHGADSVEYKAVDRAWAAVNVTADNTPSGSPAETPTED
ncbi:M4 family metallopeptidase [Streptomyces netropsis]|uniref:Neutral metalloproteinase n=1 Tax=Streptomyces netropsis TaxID=55404 RepID=A0A7W7L887_STRNE|nr:M4 family metallopeptidase [Streptomyces netropsis]MBB4885402.1 Zn-dependent metalloprotease [Streptomyces netropsis]GGR37934.1 peptidase [Streptomyces netropsis]